ncbi:MAG TPA: MFS transporter [Rhizomicrobium sp.]|nr:MFS transporter [Rhizomicrobium sp.]
MHETNKWDARDERLTLLLMFLGLGLVGLDRFSVSILFPALKRDLGLDYQDLGNTSSVLALAWGVACIFVGQLADRIGRRNVLLPALIIFSAMAGFTGLVTGVGSLLALRVLMGFSEGGFVTPATVAAIETSKPSRRGLNFGILGIGTPIIGLGLGPIIATQLLRATGSWRAVFGIVSLPGFLLAYAIYKIMRSGPHTPAIVSAPARSLGLGWLDALQYRNVVLACIIMLCLAGAANIVIAMTPSYLVDHLKMSNEGMGFIMSGVGFGSCIGTISMPALSDYWGRKTAMLVAIVAAFASLWAFSRAPNEPVTLFVLLAAATGFSFSALAINVGPLTFESVPRSIASTANGLVSGAGEILGGAIAPFAAGYIAKRFGIEHVFGFALVILGAGILCVFFVREPGRMTLTADTQRRSDVAIGS